MPRRSGILGTHVVVIALALAAPHPTQAQNPTITSLNPGSAASGSGTFTMSVFGANYFQTLSTVQWNGAQLPTQFINSGQLVATVAASLVASPGTPSVTVVTQDPDLPRISNAVTFTINPGITLPASLSFSYQRGASN